MFNGLRPPRHTALIGPRRRRVLVLVAALGPLLLAALLSQQFVAAEDEYVLIEARILAQRHDDGRVEVVLEVRRDGDRWREQITPIHRFLPDPAPIGVWWNSTPPVTVPGVPGQFGITARRIDGGHVELGLQRVTGVHWGERLLPRLRQLGTPRYGPVGIRTSPIELVDEGPTVCYLGLVVSAGERCRIAETRSHFAVRTDGVAIYPPSWSRRGSDSQPSLVDPDRFRSYLRVHVPAGVPAPSDSAKSLVVERISGRRVPDHQNGLRPAPAGQRRGLRRGPARPLWALLRPPRDHPRQGLVRRVPAWACTPQHSHRRAQLGERGRHARRDGPCRLPASLPP